jgi:hypothetical protein
MGVAIGLAALAFAVMGIAFADPAGTPRSRSAVVPSTANGVAISPSSVTSTTSVIAGSYVQTNGACDVWKQERGSWFALDE